MGGHRGGVGTQRRSCRAPAWPAAFGGPSWWCPEATDQQISWFKEQDNRRGCIWGTLAGKFDATLQQSLTWIVKAGAKGPGLRPPGGCARSARSGTPERWGSGVSHVLLTCILPLSCNEHESYVKRDTRQPVPTCLKTHAVPAVRRKHQRGTAPGGRAGSAARLAGRVPDQSVRSAVRRRRCLHGAGLLQTSPRAEERCGPDVAARTAQCGHRDSVQ